MENLLLSWGLSHTLSKLLPYLLMVSIGLLFLFLVLKKTKIKRWLKWTFAILALVAPFGIYFGINPIYQGDFSQNGSKIMVLNAKTAAMKDGLLVLAIPGCPYCFESIASLKKLKERNPKLKIHFAVTGTEDSLTVAPYKYEAGGKIHVELMARGKALTEVSGGKFPTFIMIKDRKAIYAWSNDQFGVRAKDKLENWE